MTAALRVAALAVALAGIVDPAFAVRRPSAVPIEIVLPVADDPTYARAAIVRRSVESALGDAVTVNSGDVPVAVVAIGNVDLGIPAAPTFAVRLDERKPRVDIVRALSLHGWAGQQPTVRISARGVDLAGKKTEFALARPDGPLTATRSHTWTSDDERLEMELAHVPAAAVEVVAIRATTESVDRAEAHVAVVTNQRRPRIFVYEPRPSWSASFGRQAIESDPLFDVHGLARTSRGVETRSAGTPGTLTSIDPESVDAIVVGGLDALTRTDLDFLVQFAERRGGQIVLVPDGGIPEPLRAAFDLPATNVTLLEQPLDLPLGRVKARASEILVRADTPGPPASIVERGAVTIVAGLDAWRFRGDTFQSFWRALAADAAARAVPKIELKVEPMLARPGDDVTVRVQLRVAHRGAEVRLPQVSGSLVSLNGDLQPLRLWPGTAVGEFLGTVRAPPAGRYDVRVQAGDQVTDSVLIVNGRAIRPVADRSAIIASRIQSTGGAMAGESDITPVVNALRALPAPVVERRVRPMRSMWWAVGFAGILGAEWMLRRRRGLR